MVRGLEGWRTDQPVQGPPRQGMHAAHRDGVLVAEGRQQPRQPLGEHGLSRARWPKQQQVVAAGGRDLHSVTAEGLAHHLAEVGRGRRDGGHLRAWPRVTAARFAELLPPGAAVRALRVGRSPGCFSRLGRTRGRRPVESRAERMQQPRDGGEAKHANVGDQGRLRRVGLGDDAGTDTEAARGEHGREHPGQRTDSPIQAHLPQEGDIRRNAHAPVGRERREQDRDVETRPALG